MHPSARIKEQKGCQFYVLDKKLFTRRWDPRELGNFRSLGSGWMRFRRLHLQVIEQKTYFRLKRYLSIFSDLILESRVDCGRPSFAAAP